MATTDQNSSMVRVAAFLRRAWNFEKAISIGLKSAEYGGRNRSRANLLDHLAPAADLVGGQVVHEHDVAGAKLGCADLLRIGEEGRTIRRAIEQYWRRQAAQPQAGRECGGLPMAVRNGRPTIVRRAGCGHANRAIFVDAAVSSMKISLSGSRSIWPSNQVLRRRRTLGRCCSAACAIFF